MNRADIWLAEVGGKRRPVLVLTRSEVIDVRRSITVAEITTQRRGSAVEVVLDVEIVGLERPSVVNCDGLHTVAQSRLTSLVGLVDDETMRRVCSSIAYALIC